MTYRVDEPGDPGWPLVEAETRGRVRVKVLDVVVSMSLEAAERAATELLKAVREGRKRGVCPRCGAEAPEGKYLVECSDGDWGCPACRDKEAGV